MPTVSPFKSSKDPILVCVKVITLPLEVAPSAEPAAAVEFVDPECAL
jgi:hypothetical protein